MTDTPAVRAPLGTDTEPRGDLCIRTLAMPADTNANGDLVSVHANLVRLGRTSMTVHLEAWVLRRKELQPILVTDGNFTYVSIDDHGQPQVIKRDEPPISA